MIKEGLSSSELHVVVVEGHLPVAAAEAIGVRVHHPLLPDGPLRPSLGDVHLLVWVRELEPVFLKIVIYLSKFLF